MKTQRSKKLIKKLENKQKKITEITEELNKLHLETSELVNKLKEEQNTAEIESGRPRSARGFFTNRAVG